MVFLLSGITPDFFVRRVCRRMAKNGNRRRKTVTVRQKTMGQAGNGILIKKYIKMVYSAYRQKERKNNPEDDRVEHRRRRQPNMEPEREPLLSAPETVSADEKQNAQEEPSVPHTHRRRRTAQATAAVPQDVSGEENMKALQEMPLDETPAADERQTALEQTQEEPKPEQATGEGDAARIPVVDMRSGREQRSGPQAARQPRPRRTLRKKPKRHGRIYRSRIAREQMHRAADRLGKGAAALGRTALGALRRTAHLVSTAAALCAQKLPAMKRKAESVVKKRISEDGHAPQAAEVELEAIRPEDYRGKAKSRTQQESRAARQEDEGSFVLQHRGRERRGLAGLSAYLQRLDAHRLLSFVFAGVACVSACMIVSILWRTVRTTMTNKKLAEIYAQESEMAAESTAAPELAVFEPEESAAPQDIAEESAAPEGMEYEDAMQALTKKIQSQDAQPTAAPAPTRQPMGKRIFHHVGGDALPQMEALHKQNRDIVGWLKIENVLDLPVVYRDNSYYLTRDFYKNKNTAGTIFLDENHPFKDKTQNMLLHGHNMKDGTMFGRLVQYETDLDYVRWHPFVKFDTLWRKEEYVIFAVLRVSLDVKSSEFFNYFSHPTFSSDAEFEAYIRQLQLRSLYAIPIDVEPTDALLTLSTCLEEDRLVIVARRVRSDEDHISLRKFTNLTTRQ